MDDLNQIKESVIEGQAARVKALVQKALEEGINVEAVLNQGLIPAMGVMGERLQNKECFVPEVLLAARAMNSGMEILEPLLLVQGAKPAATVVLGTVRGDVHDIGKNLVGIMLRGAGFEVIDLGVDTPPERFVEAARESRPQLIGISALLTTSMSFMRETLQALERAGLRGQVKTMVGGAIVTPRFASEIGADGYAANAGAAVNRAKELLALS